VAADRVVTSEDFKRLPVTGLTATNSVQIVSVRVLGDLSEHAVKSVVEKKLTDIKADYAAELSSQPKLKGKMVVEFVIQADGTVRDVRVTTNQLTADLENKLINLFEAFNFSKPTSGEATVTVTLNFKP